MADRRLRRQRALGGARLAAYVAVLAAGGVAAALTSDAAPTGIGALDAVYRAAAVVAVGAAAGWARRWAPVVAAVVVTVSAAGWWALAGGGALVAQAFLVVVDRRDRALGAAAGVGIGLGALHLELDLVPHASTVVGVAAAALVVAAGLRRAPKDARRAVVLALQVAVGLVVVAGVLAGWAVWSAREPLERSAASTTDGVRQLRDGQPDRAEASLRDAAEAFDLAEATLDRPWLLLARAVPVLGQNLRAVQDVATLGGELTTTAATSARQVDYERLSRPDGGIDLAVLESFRTPITQAAAAVRRARTTLEDGRSTWLLGPLEDQLVEFRSQLSRLGREADLAEQALLHVPDLLGRSGARRYLVLLGNPAESRDLGGHIGNWVELVADDGRLELVQVGDPLDLADPSGSGIQDPDRYPVSLMEMRPARFPQNWSATSDLPTATLLAAELFRHETGRRLDGVLYADPRAFAAFVGLSGPVAVPGLDGFELTGDNAAAFLVTGQYTRFPDDPTANEALKSVLRTVFERLTSLRLPGPRGLAETFAPLVRSGRLQLASMYEPDDDLLEAVGLRGAVPRIDGTDLLGIVNRNANPSKIDAFLERRSTIRVRWDPETGAVRTTVDVTLTNRVDPAETSRTVVGNDLGQPLGTNVTDLAVLSPATLTSLTVDGSPRDPLPQWEGRYWRHSVRLLLAPGASVTVRFELAGEVAPGPTYRLDLVGQPLVSPEPRTLVVTPELGRIDPPAAATARGRGAELRVDGAADRRVDMRLRPA